MGCSQWWQRFRVFPCVQKLQVIFMSDPLGESESPTKTDEIRFGSEFCHLGDGAPYSPMKGADSLDNLPLALIDAPEAQTMHSL
jgi:hypothetical protein